MDDRFTVEIISQTPTPQSVAYGAMHQDYAEGFVWDSKDKWPSEKKSGELLVKHLLSGGRGHWGPLEHPQIVLNFGYFPHSTMQQMRTHRNVSFDVQCLAGHTKIKTWDGRSIKIQELYDMEEKPTLASYDEVSGLFVENAISEVFSTGKKRVHLLSLDGGLNVLQLYATLDHKFLTDRGWVTLKNLERSDHIICNGYQEGDATFHSKLYSILKLKELEFEPTYDISMEGEHKNYLANGMVVHNSFRYTGKRILDVLSGKADLEEIFYLRPSGTYRDRQGKNYDYTPKQRREDLDWCLAACNRYATRISEGVSEEQARGLIPFDVRQHWVMSANARSLMHLLDIRGKYDVQQETRELTEMMFEKFQIWMPEIALWYEKNRWRKAQLAP